MDLMIFHLRQINSTLGWMACMSAVQIVVLIVIACRIKK